jgi:hypothetical protein
MGFMKTYSEQFMIARRVCDEALTGKLDIAAFYTAVGELSEFSGFAQVVLADVLDLIEHEAEGQEWQTTDILISRLLLDAVATDEQRTAARAFLRRNLRADTDVATQVNQCLAANGGGPRESY